MMILRGISLGLVAGLIGLLVRDVTRREAANRAARAHLLRRLWRETREE